VFSRVRTNTLELVLMGKHIIIDVQPFRGANCDTDLYLVVAKVRQRLAVINKQ
jgi:hypothetical protein